MAKRGWEGVEGRSRNIDGMSRERAGARPHVHESSPVSHTLCCHSTSSCGKHEPGLKRVERTPSTASGTRTALRPSRCRSEATAFKSMSEAPPGRQGLRSMPLHEAPLTMTSEPRAPRGAIASHHALV